MLKDLHTIIVKRYKKLQKSNSKKFVFIKKFILQNFGTLYLSKNSKTILRTINL